MSSSYCGSRRYWCFSRWRNVSCNNIQNGHWLWME